MNDELTRDFKGIWIPKEIWLDSRLNTIDKIILLEIDSLDNNENGCYASNQYLSKFCQCAESTVSSSISKLIELGYLKVIKFDGRKRYLKSSLLNFRRQTSKNWEADFGNLEDINIYNNIDNNNDDNIYDYLQNNGFNLSPIHYEVVKNWKDNDLTRFAIKKAVLNNKYNISYIDKILYNWGKNNVTTVEQAIQQDEEFKNRMNNYYKNKYKTNKTKEDIIPDWFNEDFSNQKLMTDKDYKEEIENILKEME